jgi:hypothetical protein
VLWPPALVMEFFGNTLLNESPRRHLKTMVHNLHPISRYDRRRVKKCNAEDWNIIAAVFLVSAWTQTHEHDFVPRATAAMPEVNIP